MAYPLSEHDPKRLEEEMSIGSKAIVDGVNKLWAGPDLGYQSEATFNKLQTEGYGGDQDYMLSGGWQSRRAQLGINKVIEAAAPVLEPVMSAAQSAYNLIPERSATKELIEGGARNLAWGLGKINEGITATSRAAGVHPFIGNTAIEQGIDAITPWIPLGIIGASGKKVSALGRYHDMVDLGFDMSKDKKIQRLINKVDSVDSLPKHIKQYTDESKYRQAVKTYLDDGGVTADIRDKVGVFVDKDGSVKQMQSRGELQLRSKAEQINTDLNRELNRFTQSPVHTSYSNIANVRHFMQEIGFTGTEAQFKALYELHHVNAIKVYAPFFTGLNPKEAAKLRKLAEGAEIYLGNDPRNLVPLLKKKHRVDADSIHTFMRENGIEGSSKWPWLSTAGNKVGSYDPQQRMMLLLQGRSVEERFEVLKGFQEWVQDPANQHLRKLTEAQRLKDTIAQ